MARKSPSRKELRKQAEAAETREPASGEKKKKKKKKAAKKSTRTKRRTKDKTPQRKKLVWGVFSGSMKEEARFPYEERDAAEEKIKQLRTKSTKKVYFIQPIKEPISEPAPSEEK